jgi:hypothetical protein
MRLFFCLASTLLLTGAALPSGRPADADPLTATIHTVDVERFAALIERTKGRPTVAQLRTEYLEQGTFGVKVFTPGRIINADRLAAAITKNPAAYTTAIERCLPWVKAMTADLRSIYLGLHGALPEARLPQIYIVLGAGNSGGTAVPGAQVLGLEVLCRLAPTREAFRRTMRQFFAHETVHAFQQDAGLTVKANPLLTQVLVEGAADFIARLVFGEEPDAGRAAWALPREGELWRQFEHDVALTKMITGNETPAPGSPQGQAFKRWIGNYNSAPTGWPGEVGYWLGMRIWERRYAASHDKHAALREMLTVQRPETIMRSGIYKLP